VCIRIAPDHGLESAVIGDDTAFKINWKLYTWLKCTAEVNRREISQLVERL
jgi:hypothetical protein